MLRCFWRGTCARANGDIRFGWVNASYVYGLNKIDSSMKKALGVGVPYESYAEALAMGVGRIAKEYRY